MEVSSHSAPTEILCFRSRSMTKAVTTFVFRGFYLLPPHPHRGMYLRRYRPHYRPPHLCTNSHPHPLLRLQPIKSFTTMNLLGISLLGMCALASGHMFLSSPHAIREKSNPNTKNIDYDYTKPLSKEGADFPCKGYHTLLSTPEGASVATWPAGSQQSFKVGGGADHAGGSCQAALSQDGGQTFRVMKSIIGGCPIAREYPFTVPKEAKEGPALFAWTWFNRLGAREMYMNCASVTISGPGGQGMGPEYPLIFTANIKNGCGTVADFDVNFPNPGRFLDNSTKSCLPPDGNCGQVVNGSIPSTAGSLGTTLRTSTIANTATQGLYPAPTAPTAKAPSSKSQTSNPSQTATRKTSCACTCNGYSFQISPDDLRRRDAGQNNDGRLLNPDLGEV